MIESMAAVFPNAPSSSPQGLSIGSGGIALVLSGVAFKIGAFPFQIWIPDVYQGAPTPVTAFLSVGSKAAGFILTCQAHPLTERVVVSFDER